MLKLRTTAAIATFALAAAACTTTIDEPAESQTVAVSALSELDSAIDALSDVQDAFRSDVAYDRSDLAKRTDAYRRDAAKIVDRISDLVTHLCDCRRDSCAASDAADSCASDSAKTDQLTDAASDLAAAIDSIGDQVSDAAHTDAAVAAIDAHLVDSKGDVAEITDVASDLAERDGQECVVLYVCDDDPNTDDCPQHGGPSDAQTDVPSDGAGDAASDSASDGQAAD